MHCKNRHSWWVAGLVLGVVTGCGEVDIDIPNLDVFDASSGSGGGEGDAGAVQTGGDAGAQGDWDANPPGQPNNNDAGAADFPDDEEDASVTQPPPVDAGGSSSGSNADDVPDIEHCDPVRDWDENAAKFEEEVLRLTNEARARGHNCDTRGVKPPAPPLTMEPRLRCAARLHSKYMSETGDFNHTTKTGSTPDQRIRATGYTYGWMGENIAAGQMTPQQVVAGWLDSDGHCDNIMNPNFTQIGIGYVQGTRSLGRLSHWWTQNFASPGRSGWF